jgi:hypothetical protein
MHQAKLRGPLKNKKLKAFGGYVTNKISYAYSKVAKGVFPAIEMPVFPIGVNGFNDEQNN